MTETRGRRLERAAQVTLLLLTLAAGLQLGWWATQRHDGLLTNAEDLGFTDQIVWNFLRGQAFRFTTYQDAEFSLDIDLKAIHRPDSLLAFHVEPILVALAPLYLIVPDVRAILWLQAIGLALGAIPAYRFARRRLGSPLAGLAFATVYLLAPLGQWAAMADFHSVALAAPLLMLAIDALDAGQPRLFLLAALLAISTKEEIGLVVAGIGALGLLRFLHTGFLPTNRAMWRASLVALVVGIGWSFICVGLIIPSYSGGAISPFTARYAEVGGSAGGLIRTLVERPAAYVEVLGREEVLGYRTTLLLAGGWLALLAPEILLPAAPVLALNVLSNSPWMAAGRAHYSASILPLLVAAAIVGAGRLVVVAARLGGCSAARATLAVVSLGAVVSGLVAYRQAGIGPLVDGLPAPTVTGHVELARQLAAQIPMTASVSASSTIYPHLSQRAGAYLFPTLHDADYVLVDVSGSAYPGEPGGVHQRLLDLLADGQYRLLAAEDGLLLLERGLADPQRLPDRFLDFARTSQDPVGPPLATFHDGALELVSAEIVPSSEVGPRGRLATLATVWRVRRPVPERPRPAITVRFHDGTEQVFDNLPVLWWYPPEQWQPDERIRLDVPGLTARDIAGWEASAPLDPPRPE